MTKPDNEIKEIFLRDYTPSSYLIETSYLEFDLYEEYAIVKSTLSFKQNPENPQSTLSLHGQDLELISLTIDGRQLPVSEYELDQESLLLKDLPEQFKFECETKIYPQKNTALEGLYKSKLMFCTQCEAEGFRKITYFLDRPDVMSIFTTIIRADKSLYPVLLSNGNEIDSGELENNRHFVTWNDPFPKPSYLFALVACDLKFIDDTYTTCSGRDVLLRIFVENKDLDKCAHAIASLKNAMKWDEDTYGREYDLDIFMIVAVDDFNMGAMENKGLNIFNTSCVLAKPETTTDAEFQRVEGVVAHEYFHNWSGNRVTCRDWFQLSLKEGFTVFRDSEFSADMGSRTVKRVEDVSMLRSLQFSEDAGPMAHAVQPASFMEISNFYTLTIYEKGAEVVRMIRTLLGPDLFRKGSDLYFERHDGQAVTIDDFIDAMATVSGRDFSQFMRWYRQAGTPELSFKEHYDEINKRYTLEFKQSCRPTRESNEKLPFLIPIEIALLGKTSVLDIQLEGDPADQCSKSKVLELIDKEQSFNFVNVTEKPVTSVLRGFSAPVNLKASYSSDDLMRIIAVETDGFCRWDSAQQLLINEVAHIRQQLSQNPSPQINLNLIETFKSVLLDSNNDPAMIALMLNLPSEKYLGELDLVIDIESVHYARSCLERKLAKALESELLSCYKKLHSKGAYEANSTAIANRSLKNKALAYLLAIGSEEGIELCKAQLDNANNMTDELSAFRALVHSSKPELENDKETVIQNFYKKWKDEALVMNHWFSVQASNTNPDGLKRVNILMQHQAYDSNNPNKLRSLVGAFCNANTINFHDASGSGYQFLESEIIRLNRSNPQIASRMLTPLTKWKRYDERRSQLMKASLENIAAERNLSKDVYEVVEKTLNQ